MAPELERRQYTRATIEWPVSIETDQGLIRGSTLNISAAGATIRCPNPPQANKYINVILEIPHLERFLEVGAEVVWSDRDLDNQSLSSRVGVKFTDISGKLNHRALHTQAKPKKRDIILAGKLDCLNLALNTPVTKSSGNKYSAHPFK